MTDLGDGQGEAIGGSSAIVLISGVPAFDVFGLFLGDIPLIGLFLGESPTMGLPLGLFVTPGLGCLVEERRRFWFRREVLKLSCLSSVVAILTSSRGVFTPSWGQISGLLGHSLSTPSVQRSTFSPLFWCFCFSRLGRCWVAVAHRLHCLHCCEPTRPVNFESTSTLYLLFEKLSWGDAHKKMNSVFPCLI